jgi:hypothetical protein
LWEHPDIYRNLVLNEMINFKEMTCDMRRQAALQRARRRQGSGACIVDVDADDETSVLCIGAFHEKCVENA